MQAGAPRATLAFRLHGGLGPGVLAAQDPSVGRAGWGRCGDSSQHPHRGSLPPAGFSPHWRSAPPGALLGAPEPALMPTAPQLGFPWSCFPRASCWSRTDPFCVSPPADALGGSEHTSRVAAHTADQGRVA